MRTLTKSLIAAAAVAAVVTAFVLTILRDASSEPYSVARSTLTGWPVVVGTAADPWVIGSQAPAALTAGLFKQVSAKTHQTLVAPPHAALGLVLRSEYDEGLQGVYGADAIARMARDAGIEAATFEPVCIGHRVDAHGPGRRELYFVAFDAPEFRQLRTDLIPPFPEHAGTGFYDPTTLSAAILSVAATDDDFAHWWPFAFDKQVDCIASLNTE